MNKLNPHAFLPSFYRYFYLTDELPNNLCNYFWGLAFAFLCLPFVWISIAINVKKKVIHLYDESYWENDVRLTRKRYIVGDSPTTFMGLFYNLVACVIGLFSAAVLFKFFHIDIFLLFGWSTEAQVNPISLTKFILIINVWGVVTSLFFIGLFHLIIAIWRQVSKMKKPLTLEEKAAKRQRDIEAQQLEYEKQEERDRKRRENPSIFRLAWRSIIAFKEKNCPLINWDYKDEK